MEDQDPSLVINTNKLTCEFCSEKILTKNAIRQNNSLKPLRNNRPTIRNNSIKPIKAEVLNQSSNYNEKNID